MALTIRRGIAPNMFWNPSTAKSVAFPVSLTTPSLPRSPKCFLQPVDALESNFAAFMDQILRSKPSAAKGVYVKTVALSSTMGPGVRVDTTPYR